MPPENDGLSAQRSTTDLVAELHTRKDEAASEKVRRRRSRRRNAVIGVLVGGALLAAAGVAGKIGWDRHQFNTAFETAETHVRAGTADDLDSAVAELDKALVVVPGDAGSLALLTHVRAQQAIVSGNAEALTAALGNVPEASADALEVVLARGVAAALAGELAEVESALSKIESGSNRPSVARARAWLHGTAALGHAYDRARLGPAIAELKTVGAQGVWTPAHRRLAALLLRDGDDTQALAVLEEARVKDPADLGISADEALINALFARRTGGVREVVDSLLNQEALTPRDRGRAHLSLALVTLRKGKSEDVGADLDEAWKHAPAWDLDTRALIIESALVSGDVDRGKKWLGEVDPDEATQGVHDAWIKFLGGDVIGTLEASAKLPQDHPRVAYVQALALAEQGRFKEVLPWVGRAEGVYGQRLELRVARARAQAHTADAKAAVDALREIASANHTARGLTALGEAQLLAAGDDGDTADAEKTLRDALKTEQRAAKAAFLLGTAVQKKAVKQPKKVPEATSLLRQATELDDSTLAYRAALGEQLAGYGSLKESDKILRALADDDKAPASALLALAGVAIDRAELGHAKVDKKEVTGWLDIAAKRGGGPVAVDVAIERNRLLLAGGDAADLPLAVASLASLVKGYPKAGRAHVLYGEALRRQKNFVGARAVLRESMGLNTARDDAHLLLVRAAVERSDGSDRLAMSLGAKGWQKAANLDLPPNERFALARKALVYWEAVDNTQAPRSVGKNLTKKVPWRAESWAVRALTELADDKNEAGCKNAQKALKMDPDLADAHEAAAECWISKHRYEPARAELEKAIKKALTGQQVRRYRRRLRVLG